MSQVNNASGCESEKNKITVTINPSPSAPIISRNSEGFLVSSSYGTIWFKDGVKIADTNQVIKPTENGYYTATISKNGCVSQLSSSYYYLTTSLIDIEIELGINIFPNPTSNNLTIDLGSYNSGIALLVITDIQGKTIISKNIRSREKIDIRNLITGTYIAHIRKLSGEIIASKKILKN